MLIIFNSCGIIIFNYYLFLLISLPPVIFQCLINPMYSIFNIRVIIAKDWSNILRRWQGIFRTTLSFAPSSLFSSTVGFRRLCGFWCALYFMCSTIFYFMSRRRDYSFRFWCYRTIVAFRVRLSIVTEKYLYFYLSFWQISLEEIIRLLVW